MNPRMTPNDLTAWRKTPDGRSASWNRIGTMRCRWDETRETSAGLSGDVASWRAEIVLACGDGDPPLKRGDHAALGLRDEATPTSDALEIVSCDPVFLGGAQPHHWEATAR